MTLIDRYLHAVGFFLPRADQDDIIKELSEDIRSQIAERETERGRSLTEGEQEQLIKQYGHPALLAGRYGPRRQLIGPAIFPLYRLVLKLALLVGIVVQIAIIVAFLVGGRQGLAIRQLLFLPGVAFVQFGCITLVFAAVDRFWPSLSFQDRWSRKNRQGVANARLRWAQPLVQLVVVTLFMMWWLAALRLPFLIFGPTTSITFAPIWQSVYNPILVLAVANSIVSGLALVRPVWTRFLVGLRLTIATAGVIVVSYLLKAGDLVVATATAEPVARNDRLATIVNQCIVWTLAFAAITSVAVVLLELRRVTRCKNDRMPVRI